MIQERAQAWRSGNSAVIEYHGLDLSRARVELTNKFVLMSLRGYEDKVVTDFRVGNLESIPFDDTYFDYTLVPSVLERLEDASIGAVVGEIAE